MNQIDTNGLLMLADVLNSLLAEIAAHVGVHLPFTGRSSGLSSFLCSPNRTDQIDQRNEMNQLPATHRECLITRPDPYSRLGNGVLSHDVGLEREVRFQSFSL